MTSISTLRDRVRIDLRDETDDRWPDATLTRHLEHAIRDYSLAQPREMVTAIATTNGSRDVSISSLSDLHSVVAVEFPVSVYPKEFRQFTRWGTTVTLADCFTGTGANCNVYWLAMHPVDASTLPTYLDDVIARGAAGYAAVEWASYATDRVNVGGDDVAKHYSRWGQDALAEFRAELAKLGRKLRQSHMFTPAVAVNSKTRDFGPM